MPVTSFPSAVQAPLQDHAHAMYVQLVPYVAQSASDKRGVLVPEREYGHSYRRQRSAQPPPHWYQELVATNPHLRPDSCIRAIERICAGNDKVYGFSESKYAPYAYGPLIRDILWERAAYGHDYPEFGDSDWAYTPPSVAVRSYVDLDPVSATESYEYVKWLLEDDEEALSIMEKYCADVAEAKDLAPLVMQKGR